MNYRYCEATVERRGGREMCGRPVDERGLCDRPGDHVEEDR